MKGKFRNKTSKIVLSVFIGFIAVSFMFTGYERMMGTPNTVAMVDDLEITIEQYRQSYNRQLEFYRRMTGDDLTTEQIENFNIRQNAVNNLVQRMLMVKFGQNLGVNPSKEEVREKIKSLPYFKTNEQFDLQKYKAALANAGYSPTEFEEQMQHDVVSQETSTLLEELPIADSYYEDKEKFENMALKVSMAQFKKSNLQKQLEISSQEISAYLSQQKNLERVREMFESRRNELDQSEQVLASHILLRTRGKNKSEEETLKKAKNIREDLTPQNFAEMAKKHTQDPRGKKKGGDLGWFEKGRMVPAFDEHVFDAEIGSISRPIKSRFGYHLIHLRDKKEAQKAEFEEHKISLTKELLRNQKQEELEQLVAKLKKRVKEALQNEQWGELEKLKERYGFRLETQSTLKLLDGPKGNIFIDPKDITSIFHGDENFYTFEGAERNTLVKVHGKAVVDSIKDKKKVAEQKKRLQQTLAKELQESVLKEMRDRVSVKVFSGRLR